MAESAEQYYNGGDLGNYQYIKLTELINDFALQSQDENSYLYGISRSLITRHVKSALKTIHKETAKDIKALELSIGDDLVYKLPQDFVDYLRVSVVTANNTLLPLDINYNLKIGETYLQDNEYRILFDQNGDPLRSSGHNLSSKPYKTFTIAKSGNGGNFQADTSTISEHGEFTIDKRAGVIYFSSNLADKDILLEYNSDGMDWERLQDTEITFHKNLLDAISDMTYYRIIERRHNVPANEKYRARNQYKAVMHKAKIIMAEFDLRAIAKVWRKGTKWVKS